MYKLLALSVALSIGFSSLPAVAQNCNLSRSVYRDANGKGFELIFGESVPGQASSRATAVIRQAKQGVLYRFGVTQSNGYGSTILIDPNRPNDETGGGFVINFFDSNLSSAGSFKRDNSVPKYAFINGLGSYDYYRRRQSFSESNPFLGDTMWVFSRCQK